MILGKISEPVNEDFSVTDGNDNLVPGIDSTAFTYHIFNDNGDEVSSSVPVTIKELGYGHYRSTFTPNSVGTWLLSIYHTTYFPWGKTGTIQVFAQDFDSIVVLIKRVLGLVQENFYLNESVYDDNNNLLSGKIRIYEQGYEVGGSEGIIAHYDITATYDSDSCRMISYKVERCHCENP